MPIQTFGLGNAEPLPGVKVGDVFGKMLATSKAYHENKKAGAEAEYAPELNRQKALLAGHETTTAGAKALHAPELYKNEASKAGHESKIKEAQAKYAMDAEKADLEHKKAQAFKTNQEALHAGKTPTYKDLENAGFEPGSPEFQEAMKRQYDLSTTNHAKEGVPGSLALAGVNQQGKTIERMNNEMAKMNDAKEVLYNVKKFREINNKYPDLWKDFNQLIAIDDPDEVLKVKDLLLKKYAGNEDKVSAIILASKYANQIALRSGTEFGKNFTDTKFKSIQKTKMNSKFPWKVNDSIANDIEHHYDYVDNYTEALTKGLNEYYPVSPNYEKYRPKKSEGQKGEEFAGKLQETAPVKPTGQLTPEEMQEEYLRMIQ
jgi:hypothetical protein